MATLIDMSEPAPKVEFYFDPICPWCWMTSRWASEVAAARGFTVDWRPVSLAIINEGNADERHAEAHRQAHRMVRVVAAAQQAHGDEVTGALYTAMGTRLHPGERRDFDAVIAESLAEAGLPAELSQAADDDRFDASLRANSSHALEIAGPDVGVPVISIDGAAFFGPVVTPAPTGEDALRLWDGIVAAASTPGFFELKRGRTEGPQF